MAHTEDAGALKRGEDLTCLRGLGYPHGHAEVAQPRASDPSCGILLWVHVYLSSGCGAAIGVFGARSMTAVSTAAP